MVLGCASLTGNPCTVQSGGHLSAHHRHATGEVRRRTECTGSLFVIVAGEVVITATCSFVTGLRFPRLAQLSVCPQQVLVVGVCRRRWSGQVPWRK